LITSAPIASAMFEENLGVLSSLPRAILRDARITATLKRIIDGSTGKMIKLGGCIVLDNVICQERISQICQGCRVTGGLLGCVHSAATTATVTSIEAPCKFAPRSCLSAKLATSTLGVPCF
jgi:hypothetical protein